jgi:hypothetical protein
MLQLQHQTNLGLIGLEDQKQGKLAHGELPPGIESKQVLSRSSAKIVGPISAAAANLTAYPVVIAPILSDQGDLFGLFEIC